METFKVFGDETVGRIFMPDGFSYESVRTICISPQHGRAVALKVDDYNWITVKGGGWNYGGPQVYASKKDEELIFGLYPSSSAQRELAVSREIEKFSDSFPKVLYYKKLADYPLPAQFSDLAGAKFSDGQPAEPCLLYTQVKCPCRVADLMYFTDDKKMRAVRKCCSYWDIEPAEYAQKFTRTLAANVAVMHKNGFINDTLDYGNVTLLGEIIDYEWVTAPGIKLLDGTYGQEITDERREKELLYGAEICLQLRALLHLKYNLFDIYEQFARAYSEINPAFIRENEGVQKMLRREKFIL